MPPRRVLVLGAGFGGHRSPSLRSRAAATSPPVNVLVNWAGNYVTCDRGSRILRESERRRH